MFSFSICGKLVMSEKKKDKPKKYSDAGKGDKSRVDITPNEWAKKWEKIFRPKDYRDINKKDKEDKLKGWLP